jgi:hypothetical protein
VLAAGLAGFIYAVTPQLVSETRNLNGRAFASLVQTLAMVTLLRAAIPRAGADGPSLPLLILAELLIAALYLTHTSTTIAFLVSTTVLSVVFAEPLFLLLGVLGLPIAIVLSGGYYLRVINNHLQAARFWLKNVHLTRAHQVEDSPLFGKRNHTQSASRGLYAAGLRANLALGARVLGENPFIVAMLVTPIPQNVWGRYMYWWAVAILVWSVVTTFGGPLRILGPGFHYMKASVFPSAYALAVTVNVQEGAVSLLGVTLLVCIVASFAALAYFYRLMARRQTEHTAQTPPDLAAVAEHLRRLPGQVVLVLPSMYADFVTYNAEKAIVWGGHSGNLDKLHEFYPVIRRPLAYFFETYHVDYLVLDLVYTTPARLQIEDTVAPMHQSGTIALYRVHPSTEPTVEKPDVLVTGSR